MRASGYCARRTAGNCTIPSGCNGYFYYCSSYPQQLFSLLRATGQDLSSTSSPPSPARRSPTTCLFQGSPPHHARDRKQKREKGETREKTVRRSILNQSSSGRRGRARLFPAFILAPPQISSPPQRFHHPLPSPLPPSSSSLNSRESSKGTHRPCLHHHLSLDGRATLRPSSSPTPAAHKRKKYGPRIAQAPPRAFSQRPSPGACAHALTPHRPPTPASLRRWSMGSPRHRDQHLQVTAARILPEWSTGPSTIPAPESRRPAARDVG